jgi:hypothetical protein
MRAIARLFRVNVSTVLTWVRNFALENYEKPKPEGAVVLEPDEMWHYIVKKKENSGCGKLFVAIPAGSLTANSLARNAGTGTQKH